ncbi:MAG: carboxypeptidase regulatory-like domain-containing protein [Acidobacteria bacterium]|nr:carboxypeptidase regulatory-like domain-containing protein [Acidobacteriota bacterium]
MGGTVMDQTGAVIPDAPVTLTNMATNVTRQTTTNQAGIFVFPSLVPGQYRLTVGVQAMQRFEANVTVQVQQSVVVDPVLKPGQTTTTVDVLEVTPMLTVDNPTLGHVLERQRIEQLPINGRDIGSLLQTVPGMESYRAYGLREGSQEVVLDGSPTEDRVLGSNLKRPPGLDTVQEFKVEVNNSSAKFTRPTTVIISTKSGTNQLHGAAFETHRNNAIGKARTRADYYDKPPQSIRNEFGASAGGPVRLPGIYNGKDRTFWFFAYEALRNVDSTTRILRVPTMEMRNGDFRGLVDSQGRRTTIYNPWTTDLNTWQRQPFSYGGQLNVIDPALMSPLAKYVYSVTPEPTLPNVNPLVEGNWIGPHRNVNRNWTVSARFDHRFSDKDHFYARLTAGDLFRAYPDGATLLPSTDGAINYSKQTAPNRSLATSWLHSFSPVFFNELLLSGSREHWRISPYNEDPLADVLGLPNPFGAPNFPRITSTGISGWSLLSNNTRTGANSYLVLDDNATRIVGRHELQFGAHLRKDQINMLPDQQQISGSLTPRPLATGLYDPKTSRTNPRATALTGQAIASLFLGQMAYANRLVRGYFYGRLDEYSFYFQDNFKVTPRLTLNLGVRWEFWPSYREKNNILAGFDRDRRAVVLSSPLSDFYKLGATFPSFVQKLESFGANFITWEEAGLPRSLIRTNPKNFGPRLGFAYRGGDGLKSFVMRGGYRISYFPIPVRPWTEYSHFSLPLSGFYRYRTDDAEQSPDGYPNWTLRSIPDVIAGVNSRNVIRVEQDPSLSRGGGGVNYLDPDQPDTRVHDWNFTRVAYVGSHTGNLEMFYDYNDVTPDYIWYVTTGERLPSGEFANVARRPYDQQVYGGIREYQKSGWANYQGVQLELERRYSGGYGYQIFYVVSNALTAGGRGWNAGGILKETNIYLPNSVPSDLDERNRFLNYQRDTSIPKHRVRWNWVADLPFGKGKALGRNAGTFLDRVIGGWQIAGMGSLRSNYFALPSNIYPTGEKIETYGYKYPIEDCRSGTCFPGYLWWNGYIPANQINSTHPVTGKPNGIMGVPANYKPAGQPLLPWPANPSRSDPMYGFYGTNTVWVPLNDGSVQRLAYNDNLHPWRNQYLPGVRRWGLDASLFKMIPINERFKVRFNADFFNVLNNPGNANSIDSTGFLSTRVSGQSARELQLTLRLTW